MSSITGNMNRKARKQVAAAQLVQVVMGLDARIRRCEEAVKAMEGFVSKLCVYLAVTPEKILAEPDENPTAIQPEPETEIKSE